jgi:cyclic beta-1,2-glucan synthetase
LIAKYRQPRNAMAAVNAHVAVWRRRLTTIQVKTPDPACNAVLNGWLLYQALACRFFARTALYQSSGAYGFRDQLQDSMAFVYCESKLAREHIVRSAGRQFVEGDVQHWWHAHNGRGVRTRFSDDLAWLPFVVDHYIAVTGDTSVLNEVVPFITMRPLEPNEQELYDRPDVSPESATVYEHCVRALRKAATVGQHGLPLMGIGDWNDGMNRVGIGGQGVSVWLAWFLITTMRRFAAYCDARSDTATATDLKAKADAYAAAIEKESWDGQWYRRAYFDDGTPLGSHTNDECQIDSIAQSWSVISCAGDADHARTACESVYTHLVREDARLIMLLTPPFDRSDHDPGYIKGYVPGVRENGAQYTHAATWAVLARAMLGDGDVAYRMYEMLNPFTHPIETYKVEPYVIAADVYTAEGHLGRGGWTWYTGSAAWAYRVGLEGILGFQKRGSTLRIAPVIPSTWDGFELTYRYGSATYHIVVSRGAEPMEIPLVDDGKTHEITIAAPDPSPLAR